MSGEGPESIPTSADPRSKRPTKKRALTPLSAQAKELDALFAKPERDIRIPQSTNPTSSTTSSSARPHHLAAPPEIVTNVQGSSAGAGSGEFHVYKASRRREYERLRRMDEEVSTEKAAEAFEREKGERERRDAEKTRRNREKREKKKNKGKGGKDGGKGTNGSANGSGNASNGVKARIELRKDNKAADEGDEPAGGDAVMKSVEEPKGIVIEED
ncbi:Uu.00g071100.m01.CDS01 [Anthostomella pinea]|uniref:Uu.00g071100.m01.CDS01 n=1 Tax=Anthostomella pinea TaxID=933095 RepID=A0AAI8VVG3_9PEZI|nr:Uu.00g071100.m01.CDS01 [Anthostomella pinea]